MRIDNPRRQSEAIIGPSKAQEGTYRWVSRSLEENGFFDIEFPLTEVDKISRSQPTSVYHQVPGRQSPFTLWSMVFGSIHRKTPPILEKQFQKKYESLDGLQSECTLDLKYSRPNQSIPRGFTYRRFDRGDSEYVFRGLGMDGEWRNPNKFKIYFLDPEKQTHQQKTLETAKLTVENLIDGMFGNYADDFRAQFYSDIPRETVFKGITLKLDHKDKNISLTFLGDDSSQNTLYIRSNDGFFGIRSVTRVGDERIGYGGFASGTINPGALSSFFEQAINSFPPLNIPRTPLPPPVEKTSPTTLPNYADQR